MSVCYFNLTQRFVIMDDGRQIPIAALLDSDGDETSDEEEVSFLVCGSDNGWFTICMADFVPVVAQ